MADPVKQVEGIVEDIGLSLLKKLIIAQLVKAIPWLAGGFVSPIVGWIVGWVVNKLGHAAIIELGNAFISIDTAHQAAKASESAEKLKEVLARPDATPKEKEDAKQAMRDAYAKLIHFNH
jgi:hypothetical protein